MRMVETGKSSYIVPTQVRDPGVGDKGPISLRDDTHILLKLKESLDQIEYGPNYDVAAERRAWQRFALAGRQIVSESQSETDEDGDEFFSGKTFQPAAENAPVEHHVSNPNKKRVSRCAGQSSSQATPCSDGIRYDAVDEISTRESDHRTKRLAVAANAGTKAGSLSHQRKLKIRLCTAN
jgi:hypothetical protein